MCDCYTTKCETCGCSISIHIADFCTDRENVHPYCPECTLQIINKGIPSDLKVFRDTIEDDRDDYPLQVENGEKGEDDIILCDDLNAYGIHLN